MKEKKLPNWLKNRFLYRFFQSKPGRLFSNWVLQGMLYMNPVEVVYKILLDVGMAAFLWIVFMRDQSLWTIVVAFIIAHTVNWLLNCQPIALVRHLDWGTNDPRKFIDYIENMHARIHRHNFLAAAAAFGSLSSGNYKPTSDIDIRVVMSPGVINKIRSANYCFVERVRAAFQRFPLDLYAFTLDDTLTKMNPAEPPIIFFDRNGELTRSYAEVVEFEIFRKMFRERLERGEFG